ncbi:hypothetical protein MUU72_30930 [Streptomyces sp. RS10V-4]|uniref:hypothetical protein n=1 Tax=Streptomyces rhizoryzae TaxID=2932493 RepID=UPI002003DEBF|nr:hypothetical protein [Streptomyces rhizoryzae]MCK7627459.1 hypothetical protein [Streptomyces rhizoryzae]
MTRDEGLDRLRQLARARALGRHVGSDRLIQAGLDALLADVDSPSLALLTGLGRREEHEAQELFDQVVDELGLGFEAPADPIAAKWALAYWLAAQIVDGSLDPVTGADLIWVEAAMELDYPDRLQPIVECAIQLGDWNAEWSTPLEQLKEEVLVAARALVEQGPRPASERPRSPRTAIVRGSASRAKDNGGGH